MFNFVTPNGEVVPFVANVLPSGKRELRKLLTLWKNGEVSKRQLDTLMGVPQRGGKQITKLWHDVLKVDTIVEGGDRCVYKI